MEAGFSFELFCVREDIDFLYDFASDWFFSPETRAVVIGYGIATGSSLTNGTEDLTSKSISRSGGFCLRRGHGAHTEAFSLLSRTT